MTTRDSIQSIQDSLFDLNDGEGYAVRDILTELRHLCDEHGLDFAALDKQAQQAYLSEQAS